jgi:uncharacterized protein YbjT (DUF2867 family)
MSKTILITGATGNIGSQVIPALLENGVNVRAYVRNPEKAKQLEAAGVQVFMGDFLDQDALNKAAENVDAILAITPPNPDAVAQGDTILKAALNSGSPYYLRLSAIGAAADAPTENGKLHYESDKALMESGLTYTILRPHYFMQNMFGSVESIKSQGNFYLGMGEGRLGMIDVRDIADCFVSLLLNNGEGHKNKIYTPTGSESINFIRQRNLFQVIWENKSIMYLFPLKRSERPYWNWDGVNGEPKSW